jgi:hypothetical protein
MMRAGLAAFAFFVFLAAPAGSQPVDSAKLDRAMVEAGRWTEQLGAAINAGTESFEELNQRVQRLAGTGLTGAKAVAEAPGLRQLVERNRENVRRSNAMLASLPPPPAALPTEIPGDRLVADARAQNGRLLELLGHYDAVFAAMASGDDEAVKRAMPRMMEGAFTLIGQQNLLFRNRQASVPVSNSTHQALGIAVQIYRTMEAVARRGMASRSDGAEAAKTVAALGQEMRSIARDSRALTAAGRRNLAREIAELESLRRSASKDAAKARLAERARASTALEEKTFEIGDRLASYAEAQAALTREQLRQPAASTILGPITKLESEYMDVGLEQAAAVGQGPE